MDAYIGSQYYFYFLGSSRWVPLIAKALSKENLLKWMNSDNRITSEVMGLFGQGNGARFWPKKGIF